MSFVQPTVSPRSNVMSTTIPIVDMANTTLDYYSEGNISDRAAEHSSVPTTISVVDMETTALDYYSNITLDYCSNTSLDYYSNTTLDNYSNTTLDYYSEGNLSDNAMEYSITQIRVACDLANAGILSLVMPFIIAGNFLVILAVIKFRKLRTSLNMFIASLAMSDMLVGFPTIPMYITYYVKGDVLINFKYLCLSRYAFVVASMSGSIISLTFMSFDRYIAIVYPLHYPTIMTKHRVQFMLLGLWTYGVVFSVMPFVGVNVWQSGMPCQFFDVLPKWYTFLTVPFVMAVCLILSLCMYVVVFRIAKKHQKRRKSRLNANSAKKHDNPRQMQKDTLIAKVMAFVLLLFVIFWLPFLATSLLKYLPFSQDMFEIAKNFALTLAMTNSMCNPVIYCWLKEDFRKAFKILLCCKAELKQRGNQTPRILSPQTSLSLVCSSNTSSIETTVH